MGTEVLRPQDWLAASFDHRRQYYIAKGNGQNNDLERSFINNNTKIVHINKPHQKESDDFKVVSKHAQNYRNQNKVSILRRGESMDFLNEKIKKRNMNPYGVGPAMYAGSAFSASPSPSDLPLPTFFKKHQSFDDSATRDLRRLLRID